MNENSSLNVWLVSCLTNNLLEAFGSADEDNRSALFYICDYVYNEVPAQAHGSPEKVAAWLEKVRAALRAQVPS